MAETVTVKIFNTEYKLRGDDSDRIREAATIVDQQMRFVAGKAPMQPAATTAVLAALNTAEQLLSEQDRGRERSGDIVARIDSLAETLRQAIEEADSEEATP